jgi:uncharacterized protein (DUF58 family)
MIKQQDAVGLSVFAEKIEKYFPPKSVTTQLRLILSELEKISPSQKTNTSSTFHELAERIKRRGLIIIISDLFDDPKKVMLGLKHFRHRKHEVIVFQILDPLERNFAFDKDAIFKDLETNEELPTQPWHIKYEYQKMMLEFLEYYKKECRENSIDYVILDTQTPMDQALIEYLHKREKMGG